MATFNLDSADLKAVEFGGLINEDVMQQIIDISDIPLPFTDLIGSGSADNSFTEWTQDRLQDQNLDNAVVDGDDIDQNDTNTGVRVGNHCQESVKEVRVSTRARSSDTIGASDEFVRQIMMRSKELRRDVEGIIMTNQGSIPDDGDSVAGRTAGLGAWLETNVDAAGDATIGGFVPGTGLVTAFTPGTKRALTEDSLKTVIEDIWTGGGDPTVIMGIPAQIRKLNEYFFADAARIATLTGNTNADSGTGQMTAKGSVNVYISDHGQVLTMIANRLQPRYDSEGGTTDDASTLFLLDNEYLDLAFLTGYRVEPLAKTGLSSKSMMHVDYALRVLSEEAQGMITDLDFTLAVTAS